MREELSRRLSAAEVCKLGVGMQGDGDRLEALYELTFDCDKQVAFNALWAFTFLDKTNVGWLNSKHDDLINRVLVETDLAKCRLMLSMLLRQPFREEDIRPDFIDFCLTKITACSQPHAIRVLCIKLAYEQMKFYPELVMELEAALDLLEQEALFTSLTSAKRQVMKKIQKHKMNEKLCWSKTS